jgi:hypothetical protein
LNPTTVDSSRGWGERERYPLARQSHVPSWSCRSVINPLAGKTTDRRAVCGKSACTVRREGEPKGSSYPYTQITDDTAKLILYSAFVDGKLEAPRSLLPEVHRLYFEPQYPEFSARTMWSMSNAFTSAFKKLDPVPQFKATAKLGGFLAQLPN